jgi:acetyl-CoA C-acetyltransferase
MSLLGQPCTVDPEKELLNQLVKDMAGEIIMQIGLENRTTVLKKEVKEMSQQVAVVGVYQTPYKEKYEHMMLEELIYESVKKLLKDKGITINDVDNIVLANSDMVDGRAISSMVTGGPAGALNKNLLNLCSSSDHAFVLAAMQIMSGTHDLTLVASWGKTSEAPMDEADLLSCEPYYTRGVGVNQVLSSALQATAYQSKYNTDRGTVSKIAWKNRKNAMKNTLAHVKKELTLEEIENSPLHAWPLREVDIPPYSDGVCVMLLASEKKAAEFDGDKAWLKGMGWTTDLYWLGERDLTTIPGLQIAAKKAYEMANIKDPLSEIDMMELQEQSTYHELIQYEVLGLCEPGRGIDLVENGTVFSDGKLPVNPSGGSLSSNPSFCTGLVRIAEAASQVMGTAGGHQIKGVKTSLATSVSGFASQSNTVTIFSNK